MAAKQPKVYSFSDVYIIFAPEGYPVYEASGQGLGEITIDWDGVNSIQERSADGRIMVSKIAADNGMIHMTMQQTSDLHKYLKGAFNFLNNADPALWAKNEITIAERQGLNVTVATGVSIEKRASQPYQAQGQMVTWSFLAANMQYQ